MVDPEIGIRLYQVDEGDEGRFVLTSGDQVLLETGDYEKAVRRYASMAGLDPALVAGPTHSAEAELELAERLLCRV